MTVIGAGVTLHEALAAAEMLKKGKKQKLGRSQPELGLHGPGYPESLVQADGDT